jgi:hypothetical protein
MSPEIGLVSNGAIQEVSSRAPVTHSDDSWDLVPAEMCRQVSFSVSAIQQSRVRNFLRLLDSQWDDTPKGTSDLANTCCNSHHHLQQRNSRAISPFSSPGRRSPKDTCQEALDQNAPEHKTSGDRYAWSPHFLMLNFIFVLTPPTCRNYSASVKFVIFIVPISFQDKILRIEVAVCYSSAV